jgi:hypothetical protein
MRIFRNEEVAGSNPASSTNAPVRAISGRPCVAWIHDAEPSRSTGGPQALIPEHLISYVVLPHSVLGLAGVSDLFPNPEHKKKQKPPGSWRTGGFLIVRAAC